MESKLQREVLSSSICHMMQRVSYSSEATVVESGSTGDSCFMNGLSSVSGRIVGQANLHCCSKCRNCEGNIRKDSEIYCG